MSTPTARAARPTTSTPYLGKAVHRDQAYVAIRKSVPLRGVQCTDQQHQLHPCAQIAHSVLLSNSNLGQHLAWLVQLHGKFGGHKVHAQQTDDLIGNEHQGEVALEVAVNVVLSKPNDQQHIDGTVH